MDFPVTILRKAREFERRLHLDHRNTLIFFFFPTSMQHLLFVALLVLIAIGFGLSRESFNSRPDQVPIIQSASTGVKKPADFAHCSHLCGADGHCDSSAFFECLNKRVDRYGIDGRERAAFDPYSRRTEYDTRSSAW